MPNDPAIETIEVAEEHRSAMIEAINMALEVFCCHSELTFDEIMSSGLSPIAETVDANRIVVYRYVEAGGEKRLKIMYQWDRGEDAQNGSVDVLPNTPTVTGWLNVLQQGLYVNKRLCDMSSDEAAFMCNFNIKSFLMVPVFTHDEFWGAVALEDRIDERLFNDECVELVRSVSYLCANAVLRAEMEREIAEKNEFNRRLLEAAPVGLTIIDDDFNIIDCNETTLVMFGVTKEYYKERFLDLSPEYQPDGEATADKFQDVVKRTLAGEKIVLEWMHCSLDIDLIPCEITTTCTRYNGKNICLVYVYDLRSIKKMEEAMAEAEKRTQAVTEASPVSYILFNRDLQPIDCNNAALRTFGCSDKQYFLSNYWKIFSPENQPDGVKSSDKVAALRRNAIEYGTAVYEWTHKTLDGELLPMENTMTHMIHDGEQYFVSHKHDLRNMKKMEENMRVLKTEAEKIYFDALTGIYNRRYFDENLNRLIKTLSRSKGRLGLMMMDVDFFKKYNDTYGHKDGDNCLIAVAQALTKGVTRADDFVARYGGEEFVAVLPNTDEKGALIVAEKLLQSVRACNIPHEKNEAAPYVTISIGITAADVDQTQSMEDYIKRADEMLYKSKQSGRNQYSFMQL